MFSVDTTKDIVREIIKKNFGITRIIDRHILIEGNTIIVKLGVDFNMNVLEIAKILQNQIYIDLREKTDFSKFKVNIIIGD